LIIYPRTVLREGLPGERLVQLRLAQLPVPHMYSSSPFCPWMLPHAKPYFARTSSCCYSRFRANHVFPFPRSYLHLSRNNFLTPVYSFIRLASSSPANFLSTRSRHHLLLPGFDQFMRVSAASSDFVFCSLSGPPSLYHQRKHRCSELLS